MGEEITEKKKWKVEKGAGGVVYKKDGSQAFLLMINPKGRNYGPPVDYWSWPKGRFDKEGEDSKQVAIREVREEGGVDAVIKESLGYVKYFSGFSQSIRFIDYFLMEYVSGDPADHDNEIANAEWVLLDEAEGRLKFKHDKEIFERAKKFLTTY
jgi:8-oxo-dGTP pyrophosphatase MutT (NUDIX family)